MRWTPGHRSSNVEDRRAQSGGGGFGLFALLPLFARFGVPGLLVFGALMFFGGGSLFQGQPDPLQEDRGQPAALSADQDPEREMVSFVSFVLDDVQATWAERFSRADRQYEPAKLVLFRGRTSSACGLGAAAMGPFYCPSDRKVYIDLAFYRELRQRFGAPGDFAQAYVIAHEIGHHVQSLLGTSARVHRASRAEQEGENKLSVRLELQADCYAGLWANATRKRDLLEEGDIKEALRAAAAIGDDRLQEQATGTVSPETWSHGSSTQRMRWFRRGFDGGEISACQTFEAVSL